MTGTHTHREHHDMPAAGPPLTAMALSATLHCLTGCAIGEVAGMMIGTALAFSNLGTIVLSIALASDTLSIATMEVVDNVIMLIIPGALNAGLGDLLFWGSLAFSLAVAGAFALPVNRWLLARGKGHAAVHETGIHGGLPPRVVGAAAAAAFVFGTTVLIAEAI